MAIVGIVTQAAAVARAPGDAKAAVGMQARGDEAPLVIPEYKTQYAAKVAAEEAPFAPYLCGYVWAPRGMDGG